MATYYTYTLSSNDGTGANAVYVYRDGTYLGAASTFYWHIGQTTNYWSISTGSSTSQRFNTIEPPTRAGVSFKGYYDTSAASGGTQYITAAGAMKSGASSNKTLYARWASGIYLTLDRQSGTGGTAKLYRKSGQGGWYSDAACLSAATSITPPTRAGYRFMGYFSAANGVGTKYIEPDGSFTTALNVYTPSSSKTIYAHWLPIYEIHVQGVSSLYLYYCDGAFYSDAAATTPITAITPPTGGSSVFT